MKKLIVLVMLVLAYCLPVSAGWYTNHEYGISISLPDGIKEGQAGFTVPKAKKIMEGIDYRSGSDMCISVYKNDNPPHKKEHFEEVINNYLDDSRKRGLKVLGKGMLTVNSNHRGVYFKLSTMVKGREINLVHAWIWMHGIEYGVFYEFPAQGGKEKEIFASLRSFRCDLCK